MIFGAFFFIFGEDCHGFSLFELSRD